MGVDVELVEGVGPVVARAGRERRRRRAAARAGCRGGVRRRCSRRCGSSARELAPEQALVGFCGGPFTVAGYLVEGRPSRDFVRVKELMYREPGRLARADGAAGRRRSRLRRREGGGRRGRDPALRLLGRRALRRRLRGVRRAVLGADPRGRRRPDDPLRHRHGAPARRDGRRRRRRDRPRLARPARRRAGSPSAPTGPCRGTSTRRSCSARGSGSRPAALDVLARAGGRPGHVFNLGHGVLPGDRPGRSDPAGRARPRADCKAPWRERRRRADGVRLARPDRGRPGLLRGHPRRAAGPAGAARRPDRALPAARDRGLEPAERDHRARRGRRSRPSSGCRSSPG